MRMQHGMLQPGHFSNPHTWLEATRDKVPSLIVDYYSPRPQTITLRNIAAKRI